MNIIFNIFLLLLCMLTSFFKFIWLKNVAPASDDMPNGKSMNCNSGDVVEQLFLFDGILNKPMASHPGCVHTPIITHSF